MKIDIEYKKRIKKAIRDTKTELLKQRHTEFLFQELRRIIFLPVQEYSLSSKGTKCCFPGCLQEAINSHVLQRARIVAGLSEPDVRHPSTSIVAGPRWHWNGNDGVESINAASASTFKGFCSKHDSELFKDFENSFIASNSQENYLQTYRSFCREHKKHTHDYIKFKTKYEQYAEFRKEYTFLQFKRIAASSLYKGVSGLRDLGLQYETLADQFVKHEIEKKKELVDSLMRLEKTMNDFIATGQVPDIYLRELCVSPPIPVAISGVGGLSNPYRANSDIFFMIVFPPIGVESRIILFAERQVGPFVEKHLTKIGVNKASPDRTDIVKFVERFLVTSRIIGL